MDVKKQALGYVKELELLQITYPRTASVGIVIRDADGLTVGATCDWKRNMLSAKAVEALAAGDSTTVISKLQVQCLDKSEISNYIWDAKHLLMDFERFKFHHIKRGRNRVAHLMANGGFIRRRDMQWVEEGPSAIWATVAAEEQKPIKAFCRSFMGVIEGFFGLGEFGWTVRLTAVSVKTAVTVRLDTVAI
ncbi:hypothetical protein Gotri_024186, partial [Gossypium trilobum]|nr:hypothetical protein [Gossypium trilobum]